MPFAPLLPRRGEVKKIARAVGVRLQPAYLSSAGIGVLPVISSNGGGDEGTAIVITGQTAVTTVVATGLPTYSISGGADAALFTIDPVTGVLAFLVPGVTGDYKVNVKATNFLDSDTQILTVTVGVVPVITSNGGGATATIGVVHPAQAVTTVVATGTAAIVYSKSGADTALFTLNASSGVLTFTAASTVGTYHVTVTATNTWGADSQDLTINVT